MSSISGKKIILGVCGSIAAYKSAFLLRELKREGAEVRVVMTPSAANFVAPLTFSSLSRNEVYVDMFPPQSRSTSARTWHVDMGLWADLMLIAPVTASTIAKITHGIADTLLTSIVLALRAPLMLAPAMDADMYVHPATASNLSILKERGVFVIDPGEGELASGISGRGRLAEVDEIVEKLRKFFDGDHRDFAGKKIIVTAGPTHEPIDAVRFISNRSSGKMGFAIAAAAANRGAEVRLVSGPVALETPRNVSREDVTSAQEMLSVIERQIEWSDVLIMAAAVADYRAADPPDRKIKKPEFSANGSSIAIVENPDILRRLVPMKGHRVYVGFALETDDVIDNARKKLVSKSLDAIIVNNPREQGAGFGTNTNKVKMLFAGKREEVDVPLLPKYEVAQKILDQILTLF